METPPTWTIMVASVGEGRDPEQTRRNVQDALGMTVRLEDRAGKPVIAYGEYRGPDDPRAIRDLARIKETNVGGVPVFSRAVMMPPDEVVRGSRPEWDLKNVRERRGPDALYTLQIGVYGREDYRTPEPAELVEFRRLAEEAVSRLRAEGEEAFYNHGPSMSSVTVGVFGPKDHDPRVLPPRESPALKAARDRHPYNLLNGQAIKERRAGRSGGTVETLQSSVLVAIPE